MKKKPYEGLKLKLLERLFGKKNDSAGSVNYDMIPEWLGSKSRNISGKIEKEVSSIFPEIEKTLGKIKNSTEALENADPEGRFHLKMVKIAQSNRDNMAKQVRMLLENTSIPEHRDPRSISAFYEGTSENLGVCLDNMMKSYQYTKLVFVDESKNVISDVNSLGRLLNDVSEPINSRKQALDAVEKSNNLVQEINKTVLEIEKLARSIIEIENRIISVRKDTEEKQKALNLLHEGELWKQYLKSKESLISLETRAKDKLSEIQSAVSPLNKVFYRLKQLSDSGRHTLKPEDREALNLCLSNPVEVPPDFFLELQKIVESGVLNIPKMEKVVSQIQLAASIAEKNRSEYQAIIKETEQMKHEISRMKVIREEKELNDAVSSLQEKVGSFEKDLEFSRKQHESNKNELGSLRKKLQENITLIDDRTTVIYSEKRTQ